MEEKDITCPHCSEKVTFKRNDDGRWMGRIAGGGVGYWLGSGLGVAGAILGFPVAMAAGVVGLAVGVSAGDTLGKMMDDANAICPRCNKGLVL